MPDLKWKIISRKPPIQGLEPHMSYLARVTMLTLLLDQYSAGKQSCRVLVQAYFHQAASVPVWLMPFFLPASMHQRHFFFAPSKIKHSLDEKFSEATSQRNRLSRKPLCHISMSWLTIAFDDQFWVTTLPNHKQVWGSYCLQLPVLVTWCRYSQAGDIVYVPGLILHCIRRVIRLYMQTLHSPSRFRMFTLEEPGHKY